MENKIIIIIIIIIIIQLDFHWLYFIIVCLREFIKEILILMINN